MIRRHITAFRLALMAADAVSAVGLFAVISLIRFGLDWPDEWRNASIDPFAAILVYAATWVALLWLFGLYRLRARWSWRTEVADVFRAALLLAVAAFTLLFALKLPQVSRLFLLYLFASQIVVTVGSRTAARLLFHWARERGFNTRYMLVVGTGEAARAFARRVQAHPQLGLRVIGFLATDDDRDPAAFPIAGSIEDIERVLHERIVDEVAICLPPEQVGLVEPIARLCEEEGRIVRIPLIDYAVTLPGARTEEFDGITLLSLVYGPDRILGLVVKRVLDVLGSAVALVVLSPLFALIALAIVVLDGRPVLFRQTRVGLHGRPFRVVKLRTMVPDAEARLMELEELNELRGQAFKLTNDPRVSRVGRVLRRTSLDELPQLWNVLRGEMSLVGPRPPLPREVAEYDVWHRRRLSMKPGITGLWQVQARREEDFDRWVELDLAYIDRWSMWLDLKIILRTIPAMLQGR